MKLLNYSRGLDILYFFSLYVLCVFTIYFTPDEISTIFLILLCILFLFSKNKYFWLFLIFALSDPPGGLFPNPSYNYSIFIIKNPIFVSFPEIIIYLSFILAIFKRIKTPNFYYRPFLLLIFYYIFLLLYTLALGTSLRQFLEVFKQSLPLTLIYTIPRLMPDEKEWTKFFNLLFFFVIVSFLLQILQIGLGYPPANLLGTDFQEVPGYSLRVYTDEFDITKYQDNPIRPGISYFIILTAFYGSMFYLMLKKKSINRNYLIFILLICYIQILLSATRGWIIAFSVSLVIFLFIQVRLRIKYNTLIRYLFFTGIILFFLLQNTFILNQLSGVRNRLFSLEYLVEGDESAGGTLHRIDEYTPQLLDKFMENPVFGWAFSNEFYKYNNKHVGYANLLMNIGIVGMLFFVYLWYQMITRPFKINKFIVQENPYKGSLHILLIGFFCIFIIHNSSSQQFSYLIGWKGSAFLLTVFLSFSNFLMSSALNWEYFFRTNTYPHMIQEKRQGSVGEIII